MVPAVACVQPLQDLLHRIRWDAAFAQGEFALSYADRVAHQDILVPFSSITMDPGAASFAVHDEDGVVAHIPLHRVRAVYKNGTAVWQRPGRAAADR